MIEVTLTMEHKDDSEKKKEIKTLINHKFLQMIYPENEHTCLFFSDGKSIIVQESFAKIKNMIKKLE